MEGIVIGISESKDKTYTFGNRDVTYTMRYISIETDEGRFLIRMQDKYFQSIPRDSSGNPTFLKNGDKATFEHFDKKEWTLDDGVIMKVNPQIITVNGHVTEKSFQTYTLNQITFFDWGVRLQNKGSKCNIPKAEWDALTGIETSFLLNKMKDKIKEDLREQAFVQVQTIFKVYYKWNLNFIWLYHNNSDPVILTAENLLELKKTIASEEEVVRMRLILEEIKTVLQNKMFMTIDDIRLLARKFTIPEQEIEQYVKNIVWRKDYDEDFTEWLNAKAKRVLYGNEGLFYILPNNLTVLEDPEPSKASYVFIGDPNRVTSNIEAIRREAIQSGTYFIRDDASDPLVHYGSSAWREILYRLKKATPEKLNWFVGRVVHYDKEQWKRDMEALLHLALRLPLAQDSSVSPLEGYALEVWICNKCIHEVRVHVKLPSKQPMDGEARICPNCGAREQDLTWNKVYEADEQGNITE